MDENPIVEQTARPYHQGLCSDATHIHTVSNPRCGDEVTISLKLIDETIVEAWFTAVGCMVSRASASTLCHYAEGKHATQLTAMSSEDWLTINSLPLTPHRQVCWALPLKALKAAIE